MRIHHRHLLAALISLSVLLALGGCTPEEAPPSEPEKEAVSEKAPAVPPESDVIAESHGHDHSGPRTEIGNGTAGIWTVGVVQIGDLHPGEMAIFEITARGVEARPAAVRVSVQGAGGKASRKGKADYNADPAHDDYDVHVEELPADLGDTPQVVVELEDKDGKTYELTLPLET